MNDPCTLEILLAHDAGNVECGIECKIR